MVFRLRGCKALSIARGRLNLYIWRLETSISDVMDMIGRAVGDLWVRYRRLVRALKGYDLERRFDFIVIGSAKCGTTSLHRYLGMHPDIYMPEGVGINNETGYFLNDSEQKIKSLSNRKIRQFMDDDLLYERIVEKYAGQLLIGEETTDYTKFPYREVRIEHMARLNERMKFVFIIRDPIDKISSQYRHFLRNQKQYTNEVFREEIGGFDYYKFSCMYFYQLQPYISRFGKESIHVLLLEDLQRDPETEMARVFEFLGVPGCIPSGKAFEKFNVNREIQKKPVTFDELGPDLLEAVIEDARELDLQFGVHWMKKWPALSAMCRHINSGAG